MVKHLNYRYKDSMCTTKYGRKLDDDGLDFYAGAWKF